LSSLTARQRKQSKRIFEEFFPKSGMFFGARKTPRKTPRFTTNPPQLHHNFTTTSPQLHHNFTTIYHAKNTVEIQNPLQKPTSIPLPTFFRAPLQTSRNL
jgi:hypothetical protein